DDTWSETGLTWNNQPSFGRAFITWTAHQGQVVTLSVTAQVQSALAGDGELSLRLYAPRSVGGAGWVDHGSGRAPGATRPQLIVTVAGGPRPSTHGSAPQLIAWPRPTAVGDRGIGGDLSASLIETTGVALTVPPRAAEGPARKNDDSAQPGWWWTRMIP